MSSPKQLCCPRCKSESVKRIPRSSLVKSIFGFIPLRRFQCLNCLMKFVAKNKSLQH